ncbi:hypothetical protein IAR55_001664 [Kwoniella newhampshirensis]|uniref:Peptide hydrolase n=1 Tax=Kwoniella newhampshirensis TaxID=1651941 RepID=A0AAW0Z2T4_9TREE
MLPPSRTISLLGVLVHLASSISATAIPTSSASPVLLISSNSPSANLAECLRSSYYGTYGGSSSSQDHIYMPSEECLSSASALDDFTSGSIVPLSRGQTFAQADEGRLVWVGQAGVEMQIQNMEDSWSIITDRARELALLTLGSDSVSESNQHVLSSSTSSNNNNAQRHLAPIQLLHQTPSSLLLHVPSSYLPIIDTLLPPHLVPVALPSTPLPEAGLESVPPKFAQHLANITKHLKFSPKIDQIVSDGIDLNHIRRDVRWLTGEAPSGIESRHSFTDGAIKAARWIKAKVEQTGASCALRPFLNGFAPNVICTYPSLHNSTEHVILSAHYDSRGSFGSTRAPGGDDDGSGSGHLLGVAHAILTQEIKFEKSVTLAFFAGEEQGLLGSHAYAEYLHSKNATVVLQVQADMLAYHAPGETLQIGLPESIHLPEASYLIGNLSHLYSPELVVGTTAACCSDHQSFVSYGFPATQVFERNGGIVDPMYHNSGDLTQREGYDFEQVVSIAKVTFAALLTVAGFKA